MPVGIADHIAGVLLLERSRVAASFSQVSGSKLIWRKTLHERLRYSGLNFRVTMASEEYRVLARECYELARNTRDDVRRRELILLAAKWAELAELIEKPDASQLH